MVEENHTEEVVDWKKRRDPISSPEHATDPVADVPYELRLVHLESGRYLNDEGFQTESGDQCYPFPDREQALVRNDELLDRFPYASARLLNPTTGVSEQFTSSKLGDYTREKRRYLYWQSLGFFRRLLDRKPELSIYDPTRDGRPPTK
jgi:hypothetical protein